MNDMLTEKWFVHGPYKNGLYAIGYQETEPDIEVGYDGTQPIHGMGLCWKHDLGYEAHWGVFHRDLAEHIVEVHNKLLLPTEQEEDEKVIDYKRRVSEIVTDTAEYTTGDIKDYEGQRAL